MKTLVPMIICLVLLVMPVCAAEFQAPEAPDSAQELLPEEFTSFSDAMIQLLKKTIKLLIPDMKEALESCRMITGLVLGISIISAIGEGIKPTLELVGAVGIVSILFSCTGTLTHLAENTIQELSTYGKLLLPVMTASLAAQGGVTSAAGLYWGTAAFDALMESILSGLFLPAIYVYLALAVCGCACAEDSVIRISTSIKSVILWCLKTILTVFTTYMSITGVISGTTDAAAMKATKVAFSTFVPMVGGLLSDASESVLLGAQMMKNSAGISGILVILALFLGSFVTLGAHYLVWKAMCFLCETFASKRITTLLEAFGSAMGILMAITASMCIMLLVSIVCFMKGVS